METDSLLLEMMPFYEQEMLPVFDVLEQHFGLYCYKHLCTLFLVQHVHNQKLLILHSSFLLSGQLLHL